MATPWLNTFVFKQIREFEPNLEFKRHLRRALVSMLFLLGALIAADADWHPPRFPCRQPATPVANCTFGGARGPDGA